MFKQVGARLDQHRLHCPDQSFVPAFVGIDDQPRLGRNRPDRAEPGRGIVGVDLDLQERRVGDRSGDARHRVGRVDTDRQRARQPRRFGCADRRGDTAAGEPGLQIPERAIDGVARRAGRHRGQQRLPVTARFDEAARRLDLRQRALDALAVTRVGHAFAAPDLVAFADRHRRPHPPRS